MKTNFYLKSENDPTKECLIYLFFSYEGNRLKYSTGQSIHPDNWNPKTKRARTSLIGHDDFNEILRSFDNEIVRIYRECIAKSIPATSNYLRQQLDKFRNKDVCKIEVKEKTFLQYYKEFMDAQKVSKGTKIKYSTIKNNLLKYVEETPGFELTFNAMDINFYDKYWTFFINQDLEDLTFWKQIKIIKQFLGWALEREFHSNIKFIKCFRTGPKKGESKKYKKEIVALTYDELMKLHNANFNHHQYYERIKDLFCFSCFTSLRYSDCVNIDNPIIEQGFLDLTCVKTSARISPVLNKYASSILAKYDYKLPVYRNQVVNREIKKICELVGIKSKAVSTRVVGGIRKDETKEKWEVISFHTGRRTFISVSINELKISPRSVMQQSDHEGFASFEKYVSKNKDTAKKELLEAWS